MVTKTNKSLTLAVSVGVALTVGACGKNSKNDKTDQPTSPTTQTNNNNNTNTNTKTQVKLPVTVATVGAPRSASLTQNLAAPSAPATVAAFPLSVTNKKLTAAGAAVATSKVDANGKAALSLPPGYYEIVTRLANGTESRSTIMQVVAPPASVTKPKPLVVQVDKNTPVARQLGKKVIEQDPDLFLKSGLNLSLVFTQAKNLSDAAAKKSKTNPVISEKDLNATAKTIAAETKKKATSVNTKAAAKKLNLQDAAEGEIPALDDYGALLAQIHLQSMDPALAAKFAVEDFDPRKLYDDAEAKFGSVIAPADKDLLKDAVELDSDEIGKGLAALDAADRPDLFAEMLREIALDEMLDKVDGSAALKTMSAADYAKLLASMEVELASREAADLLSYVDDLADGDVADNSSDDLTQLLAELEDAAASLADITAELDQLVATFSTAEQQELTALKTEIAEEETQNDAVESGAEDEAKEAEDATEQPAE